MNEVLVTIEQRYHRTPDGRVWAPMFAHDFWARYLEVFERVRVVARVREVVSVPDNWQRADGERVLFSAIPHYIGPWQYLLCAHRVVLAARAALLPGRAIIMRVDSQIAACIFPVLQRTGRPFGVEVVVDPYDVFAPGGINHVLRPFFRWKFTYQMRNHCAAACAAAYVTAHALQRRYPPASTAFSTHYSSVELPEAAFCPTARLFPDCPQPCRIVSIAYLVDSRKGIDVLLEAAHRCITTGTSLDLTIIGDGRMRPVLQQRAAQLGIGGQVHFPGHLPVDRVHEQLDQADLFVLPSRGEGLPRALIEAMARGLPAIGTYVGGFPELLPANYLVPPGDPVALAAKIKSVIADPPATRELARENLKKALAYRKDVLRERRMEFYRFVKARTDEWNARRT